MRDTRSTSPVTIFFLVLPYGISGGFATVTLPFALTRAGFSVAMSASIVAFAISSNIWRFAWGPVADLTLTLRRWYAIGLVACAVTLLVLGWTPLDPHRAGLLTLIAFGSQVAATLVVLPVGGLMAHTVADAEKGRAAGWYQAGNLGGGGLGGGAGVWLVSHFSTRAATAVLAAAIIACVAALYFVPDVQASSGRLGRKLREIGGDFRSMAQSPAALLTIALFASPIGIGAANNIWSAVAPDWRAGPNTVALATGVFNGVTSAIGCLAGGWIADRAGRWWAFFGSGVLLAAVAVAMAVGPRTPAAYATGVLVYAGSLGVANAAFSALALHVIGRGAASAKYAILSSIANVPVAYMTAFDGWAHDRSGSAGMLHLEALLAMVCIAAGLLVLRRIQDSGPALHAAHASAAQS